MIDGVGVVGQVTRVYPWLSEVTLITDKGHLVPVLNTRNGLRAVLSGTGNDGALELKFVPLNADFENGDQLVTSGIDGVYPPGLPVAQVTNVERNAAFLFARIVCKPLAGREQSHAGADRARAAGAARAPGRRRKTGAPGSGQTLTPGRLMATLEHHEILLPVNPAFIVFTFVMAALLNMLPGSGVGLVAEARLRGAARALLVHRAAPARRVSAPRSCWAC